MVTGTTMRSTTPLRLLTLLLCLGVAFSANAAKRDDDAIRLARRAVSRLPSEPGIAAMAANILRQQGRVDEAREAARAWRRLVPENTRPAAAICSHTMSMMVSSVSRNAPPLPISSENVRSPPTDLRIRCAATLRRSIPRAARNR